MQYRKSGSMHWCVICAIAISLSCDRAPDPDEDRDAKTEGAATKVDVPQDGREQGSGPLVASTYRAADESAAAQRKREELRRWHEAVRRTDEESQAASRAVGQRKHFATWPEAAQRAAKLAEREAKLLEERPADWPDDVLPLERPSIKSFLPKLSTVRSISASLTDVDGNEVKVNVPQSHWPAFVDLLADSQPVTLESEILIIAYVTITTAEDKSYSVTIMSYFANPTIFHVESSQPNDVSSYFATRRPELDVLAFFEALQDEGRRRKLVGWYPPE